MSITSPSLLTLVVIGAVIVPLALVLVRQRTKATWQRAVGSWVAVVVAQVLAVASLGLYVNRQYGFYSSWDDALGKTDNGAAAIAAGGVDASSAGSGSFESFPITTPGGGTAQSVAWLPPGYHDKANANKRYPVLVVLPGYANTVGSTVENLNFGQTASALVEKGTTAPFVAVFAPYQTVQGRDTECTNITHGPQELTFLTRTVPNAIRSHLRVTKESKQWSALGWSTGGYCAAKALYTRSGSPWGSAVSMGGYFESMTDGTTGDLYRSKSERDLNSPSYLYRLYQMPTTRMLVVASREDKATWTTSKRMADLAKADPHVSAMWIAHGGHNYNTYVPHLGEMIQWAFTQPQT